MIIRFLEFYLLELEAADRAEGDYEVNELLFDDGDEEFECGRCFFFFGRPYNIQDSDIPSCHISLAGVLSNVPRLVFYFFFMLASGGKNATLTVSSIDSSF